MEDRRDLANEVEQAEGLLGLLQAIHKAYENLPEIDLADDVEQAEKLLGLLKAIHKEAGDLPDLPES